MADMKIILICSLCRQIAEDAAGYFFDEMDIDTGTFTKKTIEDLDKLISTLEDILRWEKSWKPDLSEEDDDKSVESYESIDQFELAGSG